MNWAAFCSYVLLTAITPGPNTIMSMSNAAKYGFKRAFPFNVGVLLGFLVVMGLCAAFSSLLYEFIPSVKPYMLVLGAAYILYLAWGIWRDKPHAEKKSRFSRTNTVAAGAALQFVNVKGILFAVTAMGSYVLPHYRSAVSVLLCSLLMALCCFVGMFGSVLTLGREAVSDYQQWSADDIAMAAYVDENAEADALFLTSDDHLTPVFSLAGRQIVCGSGSFLYFHGMDYGAQYNAMVSLYETPDEATLLAWGIDYVLFDGAVYSRFDADENWYSQRYELWYSDAEQRIYKIT